MTTHEQAGCPISPQGRTTEKGLEFGWDMQGLSCQCCCFHFQALCEFFVGRSAKVAAQAQPYPFELQGSKGRTQYGKIITETLPLDEWRVYTSAEDSWIRVSKRVKL